MNDFADWLAAMAAMREEAERLQQRFRISAEDMRQATQALAPAFMLGFDRLVADQAAFAQTMQRFAGSPGGSAMPGGAAMQGLFGAPGLAEAVARQAAMASGLAPDMLMRLMPDLSAMAMDAFLKGGADGRRHLPTDLAAPWMAELMRRSANALEAFGRPAAREGHAPTTPAEAMARMMTDTMAAFGMPFAAPAAGREPPRTAPPPPPPQPFDWLDAGRQMQAGYVRDMMAIFDRHPPASKTGETTEGPAR
ncbi:hypothetical protein [Aureimonas frigidaquae]|uniref:hypothetical protein n=1 Tax=Aureimonas frigidaquae TaxID=424757 RepID=UPI0007818FDF|nr:hypothetical protein [Aureimonas frigidaquae]